MLQLANNVKEKLVYPNPVKNTTTLEYELLTEQPISVVLYNLNGQLVKTYIDNVPQQGKQELSLDFSNVSLGNYILVIKGPDGSTSIKITKS